MSIVRKKWHIDNNGRQCRLCTEYKTWDNFYKESTRPRGHQAFCKACDKVHKTPKRIKRAKVRTKEDMGFLMRERLRSRLREAAKASKTYKKAGSFTESLGCSNQQLREHLESLFLPGMSWDNYGFGHDKWNIDHIRPLSSFDLTDPEQYKLAAHYTNTQPMWQPDNFRKGNSF